MSRKSFLDLEAEAKRAAAEREKQEEDMRIRKQQPSKWDTVESGVPKQTRAGSSTDHAILVSGAAAHTTVEDARRAFEDRAKHSRKDKSHGSKLSGTFSGPSSPKGGAADPSDADTPS